MGLPIVIIGTGLAGYNLAREFRQLDQTSELVLISSDGAEFYSKPILSNALSKGLAVEEISTSTAEQMAEQLNATIYPYSVVQAINSEERWVEFAEQRLAYRDLVLAVGAEPWIPPYSGDVPDIYSVNDLNSYAQLREALPSKQRVLVLGAGLIGSEIANDLLLAGHQVSVVAPCAWPLPEQLPEYVGRALQQALSDAGADYYLNNRVVFYTEHSTGFEVQLAGGEQFEVDLVVTAAGLHPRTGLARVSGLAINRGILVDRYLQTSVEHVYALGDCVEVADLNLQYILPMMAEVRALAKTLAGEPTQLAYGPMPVVVKTPALPIVFAGKASPELEWRIEGEAPDLKLVCYQGEQLQAYVVTGEKQRERLRLNRQLLPTLPAL